METAIKKSAKTSKDVISFSVEEIQAMTQYKKLSEKFKGVYFFTPPSSSSARRSYEEKNSFHYKSDNIELNFSVRCSCKNVYVNKSFYVQGVSKTCAFINKFIG